MHKYLRAIGLSRYNTRKEIYSLIRTCVMDADIKNYTTNGESTMLAEYCKEFLPGIGLSIVGELDENNSFTYDYYLPYIRSDLISSYENITIERHAAKESYAGMCDDLRVGVSLIFYLNNIIDYLKVKNADRLPMKGTSLCLSALSVNGTIMMPIEKNEKQKENSIKKNNQRYRLIEAARKGDEKAIEILTLDDMDTYSSISKVIYKKDLFSIVDSYLMPYGIECDQYSILGEIVESKRMENTLTGEKIYRLIINCSELNITICINEEDLYGEPEAGRRFKGNIWLQGVINFPK